MTFMMDWTCTSITLQSIIIYAAHHRRRRSSLSLSFYSIHGALPRADLIFAKKTQICMLIFFIISLSILFFKEISLVNRALKDAALNMGRDYNSDISFFFLNSFKTRAFFCNRRNKFVC